MVGPDRSTQVSKKRRSADFEIVTDDDADIVPAPAREREPPQRRGLETDQQREQAPTATITPDDAPISCSATCSAAPR